MFPDHATHAVVTCWKCGHKATLYPSDVPEGISEHQFSQRARCSKCGAGWPTVDFLPRKPNPWMQG